MGVHLDNINVLLSVSLSLIIYEPQRTSSSFLALVLVLQNVHKCCLLRQKADEELRRMETTVGEPTDANRVRIFTIEDVGGKIETLVCRTKDCFSLFCRKNSSRIC